MKEKLKNFIPSYACVPLMILLLMNTITYNGSKIITSGMIHHCLITKIDTAIPFVPFFVLFYVLAYVQWVLGYIIISRENKEYCYKYLSGELIAKFLCLICFIIYPTIMFRPEVTGNNIFDWATKIIYFFDEPVNLFPSIHCLESWFCFRGSIHLKKVPKWYKWVQLVSTVLVFLSTVFIKQHVVLDIIGGIIVGEIGLFLARHFHTSIIFEKLEMRLEKIRVKFSEKGSK